MLVIVIGGGGCMVVEDMLVVMLVVVVEAMVVIMVVGVQKVYNNRAGQCRTGNGQYVPCAGRKYPASHENKILQDVP